MLQRSYTLDEYDEVTRTMLSESTFFCEFYKINIKFNTAAGPTCMDYPANSVTTIILKSAVFAKAARMTRWSPQSVLDEEEEECENRSLMIFSNICSGNNDICIPKTLIDEDYMGLPVVHVLNNRDYTISRSEIEFKVNQYWFDNSETNIHTFPLFYIDEEDAAAQVPMISGFRKSTTRANGLDIIMNNNYSINPLEIIDIPCKFYFNTSTLDFQNLFLMRSRFSKLGVFCSFDQQLKLLRVINQSNETVNLGMSFLQLLLPTPLCFRLDEMVINVPLLFVKHSIDSNCTVHSCVVDRKNKY